MAEKIPKIFICYAHEDNENPDRSKRWLDRLLKQLAPLKRLGEADIIWSDQEIELGEKWHDKIQTTLQQVKAAVLLVSSSFLASEYIHNSELPVLLKNAKDKRVVIIPILLEQCLWKETPFRFPDPKEGPEELSLSSIQVPSTEPLNSLEEHEQDEVLYQVTQKIYSIVNTSSIESDLASKTEQQSTQDSPFKELEGTESCLRQTVSMTSASPTQRRILLPSANPRETGQRIAPNPFGDRGKITQRDRFFNRTFLLQEIFEELSKGGSISLVGESQVGKSSLLSMICQEGSQRLKLSSEAFIDLDMQLIRSDEEFFEELCAELKIECCRGRKLQRQLRGKHHILCLDQIEKMTYKENFTQEARAELRGLADGRDTPLTLVIASRSGLDRLFPESSEQTSPLYNLCRRLEVKSFTFEDACDFLLHRLRGTGIQFSESQIEELWTKTQGHPAKLQAAAHELYAQLSL